MLNFSISAKNSYQTIKFFFLFSFVSFSFNTNCQNKVISTNKLIEDFRVFKLSLQETHANLYWHKNKIEMNDIFDNVESQLQIPQTEESFFELLNSIVDSVNCGHTSVTFSKLKSRAESTNKFFPFTIRIISEKILIEKNLSALDLAKGTEILSINGVNSTDILKKIYSHISSDKGIKSKKIRTTEIMFSFLYALFIERPKHFELIVKNSFTNKVEKIMVKSIKWDNINLNKSISEFISKKNPIEFKVLNKTTALLQLHSFEPRNLVKYKIDFEDTLGKIFSQIKESNIEKLVIDLRDNRGGSLSCGNILYSYLVEESNFDYLLGNFVTSNFAEKKFTYADYFDDKEITQSDTSIHLVKQTNGMYLIDIFSENKNEFATNKFTGKIFLLVNGLTFSSASLFTSYCKANRSETLIIGDTPGGAYEGCSGGGPVTVTLPNSKMKLFFFVVKLNLNVSDKEKHISIPMDFKISDPLDDQIIFDFVEKN